MKGMQKSIALPYTIINNLKNENNFIYNNIKHNKILRNKLNQKAKCLYTKHYKTLLKTIREEDTELGRYACL